MRNVCANWSALMYVFNYLFTHMQPGLSTSYVPTYTMVLGDTDEPSQNHSPPHLGGVSIMVT